MAVYPSPNGSADRGRPRQRRGAGQFQQRNLTHAWLSHHLQVLLSSLGQLIRTPLPSLMTAAVIGIALALPAGLYVLLENARHISEGWDGSVQLSLFLKPDIQAAETEQIAARLRLHPDIAQVRLISRNQALDEYKQLSGFSDVLASLQANPLPAVLVIQPRSNSPAQAQSLAKELKQDAAVEIAQFDMRWLKRLFAIMAMVQRGITILAALLALAVVLIIGNTIRLAIYNRRDEIEVNKLFGATDAFIRRPFLYSGLWYGFSGGLIAWLLLQLSFWALQTPARHLVSLYYSDYQIIILNFHETLLLLLAGTLLGLGGAWLAVSRHLRMIVPQ